MGMPDHIKEKLERLYRSHFLGAEEIQILEKWLDQIQSDSQVEQWLSFNWKQASDVDINISFDEIRRRIKKYGTQEKKRKVGSLFLIFQKIAAILVLPLLVLSVWLYKNHQTDSFDMALATEKGERTHVFLPDGSEVWLNVDSRLDYSTNYKATNRSLKLSGEAFFKVAKGQKFPFMVDVPGFQVKAVGTEFNVSAYNGDDHVTAFLKEGVIELRYAPEGKKEQVFRMSPGEKAVANLSKRSMKLGKVTSSNDTKWINGELFFENEPMDEVFEKIERWYNVKIEYDSKDFQNETLTVSLRSGESIGHLIQIIDEAIGLQVKQTGNEYVIKRRHR